MKKFLIFLLLILAVQGINAQQEIFVSGQVLDSLSGKGLESCAVGFFNDKNTLVSGTTTDHKGYFEIALRPGKYQMVLDYIGYQKKTLPVFVRQNNQFLGTYTLAEDQTVLASVEVKAKGQSFKVDKEVYAVSKKMKIAAANTNDVLDRIQGVTYDRYNDQIKVDGQTNIKILVDGLEKDEDYIRNLNPDRLKKVEVIRDPSGKYALDGYTAVINVILKKNYTGTELNLSHQSVFDSDAKDRSHMFPMTNTSAGFTYTYNKINVYTKYSVFTNDFYFPTNTLIKYKNGLSIDKHSDNGDNNFLKKATNDRLTFGVDYYLNPRHTLSFETGFRNLFINDNQSDLNYLVDVYMNQQLQTQYKLSNAIDEKHQSNYQSLFYIGKFDADNELRIDATFAASDGSQNNVFYTNDIKDREEDSQNDKNSFRLNADYTRQLNERSSLELGYGFYHQKQSNTLLSKYNNQQDQTTFDWQESRHKAYAYYAYKLSQKWSLKTGLAAEISLPKIFNKTPQYLIYQPYLDLKYRLSKSINLKLKYRTESDYPALSQANPNSVYIDPEHVQKGNPDLRPEVTHQISLRANFFGGALFAEPYYHFSENYIGQISHLRNDGIIEHSFDNIGHYRHYGIKGNVAVPFSKKIFWQTGFDVYHSSIDFEGRRNAFNDYSLESNLVYVNQDKGLTSGFVYQRGMNKYISAQGYHKWNNDFLGFLMQKSFLKKRLNLMLLYMLPVDFGVQYVQEEYTQTPQYESLTQYDIHLLKNIFVFRLNYRFSKGKATRKTKKNIDEDEPKSDKKGLF